MTLHAWCNGHDHSLPRIEGQCRRSGSRVGVRIKVRVSKDHNAVVVASPGFGSRVGTACGQKYPSGVMGGALAGSGSGDKVS